MGGEAETQRDKGARWRITMIYEPETFDFSRVFPLELSQVDNMLWVVRFRQAIEDTRDNLDRYRVDGVEHDSQQLLVNIAQDRSSRRIRTGNIEYGGISYEGPLDIWLGGHPNPEERVSTMRGLIALFNKCKAATVGKAGSEARDAILAVIYSGTGIDMADDKFASSHEEIVQRTTDAAETMLLIHSITEETTEG